jgi:dTDP-4-dehydrorhamnose reductase
LVFGCSGQVAHALRNCRPADLDLTFAGRETFDLMISDPATLIEAVKPSAVINAAAYTAVDRAEQEVDAANRLNHWAPKRMAMACADLGAPFVHLSTDYVFDGLKHSPYIESDARSPINAYGKGKAEGETAVWDIGGRWTIFRTSWVFSPYGSNFVKTMHRLAQEREVVNVVADQQGRPTLASDIADLCLDTVRRGLAGDSVLQGLFHLAGADDAVWADIADVVFDHTRAGIGRRPHLNRINTADYPTPAKRPANSRLDTSKLQHAISWTPRPWRDTLHRCLIEIAG